MNLKDIKVIKNILGQPDGLQLIIRHSVNSDLIDYLKLNQLP